MEPDITLIGERIKKVRMDIAHQSQEGFALILGMTQSNLSLIENQRTLPSTFLLYRIHITYHINLNWLIAGIGSYELNDSVLR